MVEADHPDSRFPIDMLDLRRFLLRAQREVRLQGEVNVRITSDAEMRRLNREFRRKDKSTDVLSFPSSPNGKSELAGDIAISGEIAYANAGILAHPFEEELKILMLHGLLHLAGYDHETDQGEMARKERRLRLKFNLPPTLIARTVGLGKGTTSVVPSKAKKDPDTSLPKAAVQRMRSGPKKNTLPPRTTRTSGAEAQKIADSDGAAKAIPFRKPVRRRP